MSAPTVFLSAVTKDYGLPRLEEIRRVIQQPGIACRFRGNLEQGGKILPEKLHDEIKVASCVIHLVGPSFGFGPEDVMLPETERTPAGEYWKPACRSWWPLSDLPERRSYTQMELDFAIHLGRPVYVIFIDDPALIARVTQTETEARLQKAHRDAIESRGHERVRTDSITSLSDLIAKLPLITDHLRTIIATLQQEKIDLSDKLDKEVIPKLASLPDNPGFDLGAYARAIIQFLAPLPLAQIVNQPDMPAITVADVFVPLMIREVPGLDTRRIAHAKELAEWDGREKDHASPDDLRKRKEDMAEFLRSSPAENALTVIDRHWQRNFILLGEAGGGKTLLSRHLAVQWALAWLDPARRHTAGRVPIYIELKDYARVLAAAPTMDLLGYCHTGCDRVRSLNRHALEEKLNFGRAFFILDGLDEVLDPYIKSKIVRELLGKAGSDWTCVLTSRIADFDPAPWADGEFWSAYRIEPLTRDEQAIFIRRYHTAFFRGEREREEKIRRLQGKLRDFHRLAELAGTPLLLTLLCLVNREPALPETRTALYEKAAELLLHNWDFFHFDERGPLHTARLAPLELAEKHLILRRLAWLLMMGRPAEGKRIPEIPADSAHLSANIFPDSIISEAVRGILTEGNKPNVQSYVERVPKLLIERNSVLCAAGEAKQSFIHRTFLEFYAAWAWHEEDAPWLKNQSPADMDTEELFGALIREHWRIPAWRVILVLYFGRVRAKDARFLLQGILDLAGHEKAEADRHELLLFAAECFSETPQRGKLADFASDLETRLTALAESIWSPDDPTEEEVEANWELRRRAVRLITRLWGDSKTGHPWLWQQVGNVMRNRQVRVEIIRQLALVLGQDQKLRDLLLALARPKERDSAVRMQAIWSLGEVWLQADWLRELLVAYTRPRERDRWMRRQAIRVLKEVWPQADWLRDLLVRLTLPEERNVSVRRYAIRVLAEMWPQAEWLRDLLVVFTRPEETDSTVRRQAIRTLGEVWTQQDWVRELLQALACAEEMDGCVRMQALTTLAEVWPQADWLRDLLVALTHPEEKDGEMRRLAIRILGKVWQQKTWLRDLLTTLLHPQEKDGTVRGVAVATLTEVWPQADWLRDLLVALTLPEEKDISMRTLAITTLVKQWQQEEWLRKLLLEISSRHGEDEMIADLASEWVDYLWPEKR